MHWPCWAPKPEGGERTMVRSPLLISLKLAIALALMLLVAACGTDDAADTTTDPGTETTPVEQTDDDAAVDDEADDAATDDEATMDDERYGGHLRVALPADIVGFDIRDRVDNPTRSVTELIFQPLVRLETDLSFQPALATDWEITEDATVFTFSLREDVRFHNGDAFTADDVVFTFESMLDPDFPSATAGLYSGIESIEAVDDLTVEFTLTSSDAEFIDKLSRMGIVPQSYIEEVGNDEFNVNPVGTGPFKFVSWVPESHIEIERNDDYWDPELPYLDRITYLPITEDSVRLASFETGEIDLFQRNVPPEHVGSLEADERFVLEFKPFIYYHYLSLNLERVEAFQEPAVRQAIAYAIDREAITEVIGYGTPGHQPLQPVSPFFDPDLPYYEYDPEMALSILDEAGIDPSEVSFTLQTFTYPDYQRVGEMVHEMLGAIGFDVELRVDEWTVVRERCYLPITECDAHNSATGGLGPDAALYARFHSQGSENKQYYSNERVDELLEQGRQTVDEDERREIYNEAITLILEDSPVIFINDQDIPALYWRYVQGFEINSFYSYMQLDRTWIDDELKDELNP
jgi:peptide/nickel transport system substrate-binding protein